MISAETIDAIRDATSLSDLVAEYVRLQPVAGGFVCKCLFHSERTASMRIHATGERKGHFKCFGCGVHGNCFSFIMQIEGCTFMAAVESLGERAGIKIQHGRQKSFVVRSAEAENRACAKWWWQKQWDTCRSLLDKVTGAEPPAITITWTDDGNSKVTGAPIPDDYALADCYGRLLRTMESMPIPERMTIFRSSVREYEREEWRRLVAEDKTFAAAWMGLAA